MDKLIREYGFGLKHYWIYFKENFKISFKESLEYKSSFYSIVILSIFYNVVYLLFGYLIIDSFGGVLSWSYIDFVCFVFFGSLVADLSGLFLYGDDLKDRIIKGDVNRLLFIPGIPTRPQKSSGSSSGSRKSLSCSSAVVPASSHIILKLAIKS